MFAVRHTLTLTFHIAFTLGARAIGDDQATFSYAYEIAPGWGPLVGSGNAPTFEVQPISPTHLIAITLAWLLGSRIWRWRPSPR